VRGGLCLKEGEGQSAAGSHVGLPQEESTNEQRQLDPVFSKKHEEGDGRSPDQKPFHRQRREKGREKKGKSLTERGQDALQKTGTNGCDRGNPGESSSLALNGLRGKGKKRSQQTGL